MSDREAIREGVIAALRELGIAEKLERIATPIFHVNYDASPIGVTVCPGSNTVPIDLSYGCIQSHVTCGICAQVVQAQHSTAGTTCATHRYAP